MPLIKRSESARLTSIGNGKLFQFVETGDKKTYVLIDSHLGTYRRLHGKETLTLPHDENDYHFFRIKVVEVFDIEELTDNCKRGFDALLAKSAEIGWPEHYRDDLWITDRQMLAERKPSVFGWAVRNTGTHMMVPNCVHSLFLTAYMPKCIEEKSESPNRDRCFFWNGESLKEMPIEMIEERLLRASCETARKFAKCCWNVKNTTTKSSEWQKQIDRELNGLPVMELSRW